MLGCGVWQAAIVGQDGSPVLRADVPFVSAEMTRVLDETSTATITLGECCDLLADIRSVRHSLALYRDGLPVWGGPIVQVNYRTGQLSARDVSWWFDRRLIAGRRVFVGEDLAAIAETLIRDTLALSDPGIGNYLEVSPCGIIGDRTYDTDDGTQTVGDALRELARDGLDFTVLGWRMIIGGQQIDTRPIATLTDDAWRELPDVIDDGLALATRTIVKGSGILAVAGGIDPYFGLVERPWSEPDITDLGSLASAATTRLDLLSSTPLVVGDKYGDGFAAVLAPSAPVTFAELVPGALVRNALISLCRPIVADLRLHDVRVTIGQDEQVSITQQSLGSGI